ncbi:MAG: NYN domain-containing protein [Candidatus Omnitrophica bacterium]|nr:NYN domain-containing protein [Candidatus Omnitrophota bacterium]
MKYIIDGYNLMHQIEQLRGKRLRGQREGLIRLLELAQEKNRGLKDLSVVFDGPGGISAPRLRSKIKIIFSRGESADKKIKEILEGSSFTRDIGVVSDDRQIRCDVRSLGAKKISTEEFLQKINSSCRKQDAFKLDADAARNINQELEQIWLNQ